MVGYISEVVAKALREWEPLKSMGVIPIRATNGVSVVVEAPLPAIAVHVFGTEGHGNTYLGGGIRQYFDLALHYIVPVADFTFTSKGTMQAKQLDLSDEIIRCMELSDVLLPVKQSHDWNVQYDSMTTDTTYATKGTNSIACDVHVVTYKCDVEFDLKDEDYNKYVLLEKVIIDNTVNLSIVP